MGKKFARTCAACGCVFMAGKSYTGRRLRGCCSLKCAADPKIVEAAFWARCDRSGGPGACWLWSGKLDPDGYGKWTHGPHAARSIMRAHAFAFELVAGPRGGLYVLHSCDVRACVNPAHLFLGTAFDNYHDAKAKGRSIKGETVGTSIFTEADVRRIRAEVAGGRTRNGIARELGCSKHAIKAIASRETWKHVE